MSGTRVVYVIVYVIAFAAAVTTIPASVTAQTGNPPPDSPKSSIRRARIVSKGTSRAAPVRKRARQAGIDGFTRFLTVAARSTSQTSKPALKATVKRLLRDLSSNSRQVRVQAEKQLLQLGPQILPLLPPPDLIDDVAARAAVERLRVRLERQQARHSVQASTVTLEGMLPVSQILQAVAQQTGNAFDTSHLPENVQRRRLRVNFEGTTFWNVVAELEQRAQFDIAVQSGTTGLSVRKRDGQEDKPLAADNSSAFRIVVHSATWKPLFGDDEHRLLRITWSITAEPRLRPLFVKYTGQSVTAHKPQNGDAGKRNANEKKDDNGTPLPPFDPDASYEIPATAGAAPLRLRSDFIVANNADLSRIRLQGRVQTLTAASQRPVVFRKLTDAEGAAKRRGGVTVTLRKIALGNREADSPRLSVGIAVSYDTGGPAFESHRTWIYHNRVFLQTPQGKRIAPQPGFKTTLERDGAVGVVYDFRLPAEGNADMFLKGMQFVYVAPTLLIDVPVTFDFENIPLPETGRK